MTPDRPRRPATMEDVAIRAGVSRALVSIVFRDAPGASPANRRRVLAAAEELSYRPDQRARLLGRNRSRTIGVVFGLYHEFHAELVERFYQVTQDSGYELALGATAPTRGERQAVQSLIDYRCEALILIGPFLSRRAIEELARELPVVVMARALRSRAVDVIRTDDVNGAQLAVEHLIGLGHRRIAHAHGQRAPGAAERRNGYRAAMRAAGLEREILLLPGGLTDEDGERAAQHMLSRTSSPTAVTAFNDYCAAGLLATVRKRGVGVPENLSLVGYDDSRIASFATVGLTTVGQDGYALAECALRRAIARADSTAEPTSEVLVPPRLVVRQTTARPALDAPVGRSRRSDPPPASRST
jgi:DNA-binding LacI/PurR family transcriptional regulator